MGSPSRLCLHLRTQALAPDKRGHLTWAVTIAEREVAAAETALIICDMWDSHWSRGARERVDAMAPQMNRIVAAARRRGVHIIHAPSDTMAYYAGTAARERILRVPSVTPPRPLEHPEPTLPIDDSDGGSDTGETEFSEPWTCQHPAIEIDQECDVISDDGREVYSYLRRHGIGQVLIMGVHTNMCVLRRSFAIEQMVRWGVPVALIRDLTDAMYNPAKPPYVSHEEGTRLVIEYIEKFWCPTLTHTDLAE